ncbi:MAG: FeoB-associated Cys-rich membrane protein [Ruminococcaceae bacterium]|nr:FeoB-associated Cys-rich membrane protein [Oscillospiraceae bacterium]
MKPIDFLIIAVVVVILGSVLWYLRRAKKKGVKCIGCPDGAKCSGACSGCGNGCGCGEQNPN